MYKVFAASQTEANILCDVLQCLVDATAQGLLKAEGRQVLNQLGFYVFLPALAFSKLAQSISWHDLAVWWPLPLNVFLKCARKAAGWT